MSYSSQPNSRPATRSRRATSSRYKSASSALSGGETSGFGAYSCTFLGVSLQDMEPPDGDSPGGWWTDYVASSPLVRQYAAARGAPVDAGSPKPEAENRTLNGACPAGSWPCGARA